MDIVLLTIVIIFRCQKNVMHNYTIIKILSIIGEVASLFLIAIYEAMALISIGLYLIILVLACTAKNQISKGNKI